MKLPKKGQFSLNLKNEIVPKLKLKSHYYQFEISVIFMIYSNKFKFKSSCLQIVISLN